MVGNSSKDSEISALRINYTKGELTENQISKDAFEQFNNWMTEAKNSDIREPNAMVLATVKDHKPAARVVLLKGLDSEGFVFYTNYESHKGSEMAETPYAALTFFWDILEKQVRIEGKVVKVSAAESDEYFWSRPKASQIGAWVSDQSTVIEGREALEEKNAALTKKFEDMEVVPRPPHWGGYRVIPERIEFWQGRTSRLHDRILYTKEGDGWKIERLSP